MPNAFSEIVVPESAAAWRVHTSKKTDVTRQLVSKIPKLWDLHLFKPFIPYYTRNLVA